MVWIDTSSFFHTGPRWRCVYVYMCAHMDGTKLQKVNEFYIWIPTVNIIHCFCAEYSTFQTTCLHVQCNFPFELLTLIPRMWRKEYAPTAKLATTVATNGKKHKPSWMLLVPLLHKHTHTHNTLGMEVCARDWVCVSAHYLRRHTTCTSHSIWLLWHLFRHCVNYTSVFHSLHFQCPSAPVDMEIDQMLYRHINCIESVVGARHFFLLSSFCRSFSMQFDCCIYAFVCLFDCTYNVHTCIVCQILKFSTIKIFEPQAMSSSSSSPSSSLSNNSKRHVIYYYSNSSTSHK